MSARSTPFANLCELCYVFLYFPQTHSILPSADRITKAWAAYVDAPAPIGEAQFINAARILIPHIEERAARLHKFIAVNRNVHAATYNRLIAEAARAVSG